MKSEMIKFNSIEEIKKYYNKNTNTFEFIENGILLDVEFAFNLKIGVNIKARNINAWDINVVNIDAWDIKAWNIDAWNINAQNINALNISAWNIVAEDITYHAVCFAYQNIECSSIKGRRVNAKHFVLDGKIKIIVEDKELEKDE